MFFWTPKRTKNRAQTAGIGCRVLSRVFCESILGSAFSRYIASIVAGACKQAYAPTTTATTQSNDCPSNPLPKPSLQLFQCAMPNIYRSLHSLLTFQMSVSAHPFPFSMWWGSTRRVGAELTILVTWGVWLGRVATLVAGRKAEGNGCASSLVNSYSILLLLRL